VHKRIGNSGEKAAWHVASGPEGDLEVVTSSCMYPFLGAREAGNLEMPTGTDQGKTPRKPASSSKRIRNLSNNNCFTS
jgi:hypothetical protein